MAKPKKRYVCQACGAVSHRWQGQCADCSEWNTLVEEDQFSRFGERRMTGPHDETPT